MEKFIDELYFSWLVDGILLPESKPYYELLSLLHNSEFVWLLSGDDNRAEDGLNLRYEFINYNQEEVDQMWLSERCSLLELLVSFSNHAQFQTGINARDWFWEFVSNLDLLKYSDDNFNFDAVSDKLYDFVWRTYHYDGTGGILPIKEPQEDQREIELWYQLSKYISEKDI
jgi:hypothetical protein